MTAVRASVHRTRLISSVPSKKDPATAGPFSFLFLLSCELSVQPNCAKSKKACLWTMSFSNVIQITGYILILFVYGQRLFGNVILILSYTLVLH